MNKVRWLICWEKISAWPTFNCVQVLIGLIVTPEGFPLGDEVFAGNTSDKRTLKSFWGKIEG